MYFTGKKRDIALSYGNQNILYNCLNKIDKNIKKKFTNIISYFGINKCSNDSVYYITGIYQLENYVFNNHIIFYHTITIDKFLETIINLFYYIKYKKIGIKHYDLIIEMLSETGSIQIDWDTVKTIDNLKEKMKKKYYYVYQFTNSFLQKLI
jgi:hypothetical protein